VDHNVALSVGSERDATIVYTPLHGTGTRTVTRVLEAAGFVVRHVAEQTTPDGRFPAVPFGVANPEVPTSMELAIAEAEAIGADLVLATDPDADRIGCCARDRTGGYRFLSGNEIGALVIDAVLAGRARAGRLPRTPLVMRTEVTSDLVSRVARHGGAQVIDDLLVGFKYVAEVIDRLEHDGRYRDLVASRDDFVGAVEESHGVLLTPDIRDKDAAGPALVLAEIAAQARVAGRTMLEVLDDIYRRVGYVANRLTSVVMKGAAGQEAIATIQARLREDPPARIGGWRVVRFVDHWDESPGSRFGRIKSDTDRAARNVLVFHLEGEGRIIIRPSGTEPKNKTYVEVGSSPLAAAADLSEHKRALDSQAAALEAAFVEHCLHLIDVELPEWGYRISGLVALDHKLDFVGPFLRELDAAAAPVASGEKSLADLEQWIDERLRDYGRDARLLMADAFAAYLEVAAAEAGADAARQRILGIERQAFGLEERGALHR
jgi:phosphoglucomutase/phosphomannomutase